MSRLRNMRPTRLRPSASRGATGTELLPDPDGPISKAVALPGAGASTLTGPHPRAEVSSVVPRAAGRDAAHTASRHDLFAISRAPHHSGFIRVPSESCSARRWRHTAHLPNGDSTSCHGVRIRQPWITCRRPCRCYRSASTGLRRNRWPADPRYNLGAWSAW
jgi:hypothetical protein